MWKKSLTRGLISYCISATASILASLIALLCGAPRVCTPDFVARIGSEQVALLLQSLLIALIGFAFGASSVLFEIEHWSLLRQGATHVAITAGIWIMVELICFAPIAPPAVIAFTISAAVSYAITWGAQYFVSRAQVRKLNEQIHRKNEESSL